MLTHLDNKGSAQMVDVSTKDASHRLATATGKISMQASTIKLIQQGLNKKGDVLTVAKIAGIQAAKNCSQLIPLCHPLLLTAIDLQLLVSDNCIIISCTCKLNAKTGVEMEALTAVSVAALTIYDMCKAADRALIIGEIKLEHKTGGKSGDFHAT